ncbi:hypothetical protein [Schleiferilactobacillus shenzhenensis]|uniref:Uncharacterized protein n=1 Tax=Schleiferilactobacillus shenzhenensis LY-73 TaxID=1231336 RepID=U4TKT3_9LACO|nr:hypothetical protein [Schleiferilactobacillus shenzhenensis]ERL63985.1 hypothetical protein L248_1728 [Schleiferilactobacillus shenzhenensis LY-73]
MKRISQLLARRRRGVILPTSLVLAALLLSLLALTVAQGTNRVQAWHELILNQQFQGAFLIAKQEVEAGRPTGTVRFNDWQSAEWELKQDRIYITLHPSNHQQSKSPTTIY